MATQNVNIGVNVSDNGTAKKVVKNFQEITAAATQAQRAAQSVNSSQGGTGGSRAVYAKSAPSGSQQQMSGQDYGNARGTAGLTGASARDFANQSQGLGGLVRLYATYAANVFAVSAAFTALSNAMDTTNMIKGLDQLGAATGRSLGGLSKRLVEITDGAISFRDSMDAVAKTTSAGMASKDVERLAMVAKSASLALGVSMPDAINRLSRGITKLEPELLDELGIFTKIDPAVQAYSRSVGKAASQLTDFERRQAFANAVLLEGEAKFGELASAAANPYDRLLASLKNVTQQALEVVNKVLGPIVSLLASSPAALAGALAVIGTVLVRQAIPALTEFKAGLASAADAATDMAKSKADDAKAARARIDKDILAEVETRAAKEIDAVDRAERKIENLRKAGYAKNSIAAKLLSQDLDDIRKEDLAKQDEIARGLETKAKRMAGDPSTDPKALQNAKKAAEANRLVVTTLTSAKAAQEEFFNTEKRIVEETEKAAKGRSIYGLTLQASAAAQDAATKKNIVSNAAYNASLIGITGALRLMNAEIAKAGLNLNIFQLGLLKAKAGVAMLIGVLGTLSAVVNSILGAIGLIVAVVGIFDSVFSEASKEMDIFNSALTKVDDAADNAARTLAQLDKKGGYASSTIEGIGAMANAFVELSSSAKEAVESATLALAKMGTWDKIKDKIFSAFGGGVEKNLAKALTKDVTGALDLLSKTGLDTEAREKFKAILGIDSLDTESVNQAILKLSDSAKNNLVTALSEANIVINNVSSRLQSFKAATEGTTKAYQDFIVSTANSNPVFKIGSTLETLAKTMQSIASGGAKEMEAAMISLAESPQQGVLFGGEFTSQLVGLRKGFLDQVAAVTAYENRLKDLDKQIETTSATMDGLQEGTRARSIAGQDLAQLKKDRDVIQKTIDLLPRDKVEAASNLFNKGLDNAFTEGSRLIAIGLGQAAEKAALTIAKANLGGLSGERLAQEQMAINKREIELQIRAIDTNIGLILSQERLRASIDESNSIANLAQAKADQRPQEVIERLEAALIASQGFRKIIGESGTPKLTGTDTQLASQAGIENNDAALRILKNQLLTLRSQLGPQLASRTEQVGALEAADITGERAKRQGQLQDLEKTQNLQQAIKKEELTRLGILNSITGITSRESVQQQSALEMDQLENRQLQERQTITLAIQNAAKDEERLVQEGFEKLILKRQQDEKRNQRLQEREKLLQTELDTIDKISELQRSGAELQNTLAQTRLDTSSQELSLYSAAYDISKQVVISQQSGLDIQKAQLETRTAVEQAEAALQIKREQAQVRKNALTAEDIVKAEEINQELTRQEQLTKNTIDGLKAQGDAKTAILQKTREINLEQERYNQLIETSSRLAESLGSVFGDVGTKLGSLAESLVKIAISTEQGAKALEKIGKDADAAWSSGNIDQAIELEKDYETQKKKNNKTELDGNIKSISGVKSLFKEKTGAYKILNGIEKVMHVTRIAMDLKELAVKMSTSTAGLAVKAGSEATETSLTVAGTMSRLGAYAAEIYGKTIGQLGPIAGPVVATALVAAMFAMFGKGGGKGGFAPTAEQRQETQGTAMGYDSNGNKVQVRRGVFGDTDAKSESIANSLELIRETSVDGLSYDNKMVTLLESIDRGINKTAKSLYSIEGLRTGSMFGTVQGTQSGGGFLGTGVFASKTSRTISDSGLLIEGTFAQLAMDTNKAVIDFFEQVTVSKKSWYGKTKTWVEVTRKEIDDATSDFFQDIFGNATLLLKEAGNKAGVVSSEIDAILASMQLNDYFISLRGLKGEDFEKELSSVISSILDDASSAIFASFEQYANFGEGMLETVNRVIDTNTKVNQQLKNILGKSITESLNISGVVVPAYREAISYSLSKLGEEASKVVTDEVATGYDGEFGQFSYYTGNKIESPLKNLSQEQLKALVDAGSEFAVQVVDKTLEGYTTSFDNKVIQDVSFAITESLVDLAGGLDAFLEQSNFFRENFMTEAERLAPVQKAVTTEMNRLGFAGVNTREEFKQLVQGLDLTTATGRENYQALMNVAEGFDRVTSAAEELSSKAKSLQMRILELTGTPDQLLDAQRTETLAETPESLRALQNYVFALEDVRTAEENLTKARQAEANTLKEQQKASESSIAGLKRYIDAIFKFKNSLLLGSVSPLTPAEKYAEAKKQFDAILATATGTAVTPAEISAKEAALAQLEGSASAFLEASKAYNASSETYQKDFSYVQKALTNTSESLAKQLTAEEKTLASLTKQITALETVNTSVLSVADAITKLATAMGAAAAAKPAANIALAKATGVGFVADGVIYGANGLTTTIAASQQAISDYTTKVDQGVPGFTASNLFNIFKDWGLSSKTVAGYLGIAQSMVLDWFKSRDPSLPSFAKGTNFVPEDMMAQIHRGERIIPAADNDMLMQNLNNRDESNRVLVNEIRNLRSEVKQLREQQAKETGNIIVANFDAQQRAAEQIEQAMTNSSQQSTWAAKVREGVKLK